MTFLHLTDGDHNDHAEATSITDVVRPAMMSLKTIANGLADGLESVVDKPGGAMVEVRCEIDVPKLVRPEPAT